MNSTIKNKDYGNYSIFSALVITSVFLYSYFLLPYYYGGDQFYYARLYTAYQTTAIWDIVSVGYSNSHASEPISLFVIWLGANLGVDRIIYEAILNSILAFYITKFFKAYRVSYFTLFLILLNGYVFALFFSAVRLKIGMLVLLFLYTNKLLRKVSFISVFAHFSLAILLVSSTLIRFFSHKKSLRFNYRFLLMFLVFLGASLYLIDPIIGKVINHFRVNENYLDLVKMVVIGLMFYITLGARYALTTLLIFSPLVFIFGSSRIIFFIFILYLYYACEQGKERNWIVRIFLFFGVAKSLFYIYSLMSYGDAFFIPV